MLYTRLNKILGNRIAKVGVALLPIGGLLGAASASGDYAMYPW